MYSNPNVLYDAVFFDSLYNTYEFFLDGITEFYDTDLSNTMFLEGLKSFNTNLVEILYQVIYFLRVSHRFL